MYPGLIGSVSNIYSYRLALLGDQRKPLIDRDVLVVLQLALPSLLLSEPD